jgi:hypothetical protein
MLVALGWHRARGRWRLSMSADAARIADQSANCQCYASTEQGQAEQRSAKL